MSDKHIREPLGLFIRLCEKPGMYIHSTNFDAVWAYIEGVNQATYGGALMGFREWLIVERGEWTNLSWYMLIRARVFDDDPGTLPSGDEHDRLRHELRDALIAFGAALEGGLAPIHARCQELWENKFGSTLE